MTIFLPKLLSRLALFGIVAHLSGCSTTMFAPAPIAKEPPALVRAPLEFAPMTLPAITLAESRGEFAEVVIPVEADLWARVRRGFVMNNMQSPLVEEHEHWYASRPDYIRRFVDRGARYMYHIVEEVERRQLPMEIVLLPIIESAFNPQAYSHAHASGMWQFIPSTGKDFGLSQDWLTDNRRDVLLSTNAALDYLTKLHRMFNSWELAFAAYNCGEGCVGRAIQRNQRQGLPTDFLSLKLPNETRAYVPKLLAVKNIMLSPESYGITLPLVQNRPYFTQVKAPAKIDVKLAARLAEMGEEQFAQLNPAFNKPIAATGTGYFLVPTENADTFRTNLELYQSLNAPMVSWVTVSAKRGQSVDAIARQHGMTASYLRATNGPFKERKGKFTQPVTFLAPSQKNAAAINVAFDKKIALKRERLASGGTGNDGDDGPVQKSTLSRQAREGLVLANASTNITSKPIASANNNTDASEKIVPRTPAASATATAVPAAPATVDSTYTVQKGDTLFSIAKRSGMTLADLKAANRLTSNHVNIGQQLVLRGANLNVPSTNASIEPVVATVATVAAAASVSNASTTAKNTVRFHTVRSGDTLFSIAKRFGTSVESLRNWNKLGANAVLKAGVRLKVGA